MGARRALLAALLLATLVAGAASTAAAAPTEGTADLRIERVTTEPDGTTTMVLSVTGLRGGAALDIGQLQVKENGVPVTGLTQAGTTEPSHQVVPGVVVAIDVSGSAAGAPIEAARSAAASLFSELGEDGAALGLLSFGPQVRELAPLSESPDAAIAGLPELEANGETVLFDGVSRAVRMLASHDGPRDVVVFSDGDDNGSTSTLRDVLALLGDAEVRVTTVALESAEYNPTTLRTIAEASGGQLLAVDEASDLAGAFAAVTDDLTNRLVVSWVAEPDLAPPSELRVEASYAGVGGDVVQVLNDRLAAVAPPREVPPPAVPVPALATSVGLGIGIGALAVALLLLLLLAFGVGGERRRAGRLRRRLSPYMTAGPGAEDGAQHASVADRAASVVERLPQPSGADEWISTRIERADWPMRGGEFLLIVGMLTVGLGFVLGVLGASVALAVLGALLGAVGPFIVLDIAVRRRQRAFSDQLSDFLQLVAGALRAGHAFNTALDGAVQELGEPASSELRRAAVEVRLGRPTDRALLGVADRMDSDDLRWVVSALAVQRTVGGNLAEVLNNVAATLRDRASVRRQVAALSAEGRLSGWAIGATPFVMFLFLSVQNPDYVALLFQRGIGRLMLALGAVLFTVGVIWLRKVVQPKF